MLNEITINSIVVDSKEISVVDGQYFNGLAKFSLDEITNCVARKSEYKITINYTTKEGLSKNNWCVFTKLYWSNSSWGCWWWRGGDENDGDEEGDDEEGDEEEPNLFL